MASDPTPTPNRYRFRVTKVLSAYRYKAARAAVLGPLSGADASLRSDIPAALDQVREQWRARLLSLKAAGWSRLGKPKDLAYAANCPPFGVVTARTSRRCRLAPCPFCYARERVVAPFRKLEAGLAVRPDLQVVWFRRRVTVLAPPAKPGSPAPGPATHAAAARGNVARSRRAEVTCFGAVYGAVQFHITPLESGVGLVRCGVLLAAPGTGEAALATYLAAGSKKSSHRVAGGVLPPGKKSLSRAFARAARFPAPLLRAPAADVVAVLGALRRFRAAATYGPKGAS